MKSRAAHLDLAARHPKDAREQGSPEGKAGSEEFGITLQAAFPLPEDNQQGTSLIGLLGKH